MACAWLLWWAAETTVTRSDIPIGMAVGAVVGLPLIGLVSAGAWAFSVPAVVVPSGFAFISGVLVMTANLSVATGVGSYELPEDGLPTLSLLLIAAAVVAIALGHPEVGDACRATRSATH